MNEVEGVGGLEIEDWTLYHVVRLDSSGTPDIFLNVRLSPSPESRVERTLLAVPWAGSHNRFPPRDLLREAACEDGSNMTYLASRLGEGASCSPER